MTLVVPTSDEPPAWFTEAVAAPFSEHVADAGGCPIHYLRWGDAPGNKPPLVLIHGGGAHAYWWAFLGPQLTDRYDVLALDLSGHGESGRRNRYPREVWAEDVLAVMEHANLARRPFLVGHSMGGFVSTVMAALHGDRLAGAVLIDSPVTPPRPAEEVQKPVPLGWTFQRLAPYPDLESAVSRFRLLPDQPNPYPFLVDFVARRSLRHDADGFAWKFDPRVFEKTSVTKLRDYFMAAKCPLAVVRGGKSTVLPRDVADYMVGLLPGRVPFVEIPDGHHHLMFDQPLPLLAALRRILSDWEGAPGSA